MPTNYYEISRLSFGSCSTTAPNKLKCKCKCNCESVLGKSYAKICRVMSFIAVGRMPTSGTTNSARNSSFWKDDGDDIQCKVCY